MPCGGGSMSEILLFEAESMDGFSGQDVRWFMHELITNMREYFDWLVTSRNADHVLYQVSIQDGFLAMTEDAKVNPNSCAITLQSENGSTQTVIIAQRDDGVIELEVYGDGESLTHTQFLWWTLDGLMIRLLPDYQEPKIESGEPTEEEKRIFEGWNLNRIETMVAFLIMKGYSNDEIVGVDPDRKLENEFGMKLYSSKSYITQTIISSIYKNTGFSKDKTRSNLKRELLRKELEVCKNILEIKALHKS
jgi:hypothetical protein